MKFKFCKCGCGAAVNRTWVSGHQHKGRTLSKEHRQKLSQAGKGKPLSKKHCQNISQGLKGVLKPPLTLEQRQKISQALKGKPFSKEHRENISRAMKGRKISPKGLAAISQANKKRIGHRYTLETRAKMSAARKGIPLSQKHRQNISEGNKGKKLTLKTRKKISESLSGPNNPNYIVNKSKPYPWNWKYRRQLTHKRDNRECQNPKCKHLECKHKPSVHHIDYNKQNCKLSNLITLCTRCHQQTNTGGAKGRKHWITYYQNIIKTNTTILKRKNHESKS